MWPNLGKLLLCNIIILNKCSTLAFWPFYTQNKLNKYSTRILTGDPGYQILWAPYYYMPQVCICQIGSKITVIKYQSYQLLLFNKCEYESKHTCRSFIQETFIFWLENTSFRYSIFPSWDAQYTLVCCSA